MTAFVTFSVTYFVKYDEVQNIEGLTVWSIAKAKEWFKGGKINDAEGERVNVNWKLKEGDDEIINCSKNDMKKMAANAGDLVYLCDKRKYLGGLKSIHAVFGEPHDEDGVVYINDEQSKTGVFVKGRLLTAEKEM
jgi:SSS family solute:Na+ symporter